MSDPVTFFDSPIAPEGPIWVEIFDPPMCCPTGLCGPALDQTLLDVNEMVLSLQSEGIHIVRYQMASQPNAFLGNNEVMDYVREQSTAALPITLVDGKVIKIGAYPNLVEVQAHLSGAGQ
jgi:hypothetical protein